MKILKTAVMATCTLVTGTLLSFGVVSPASAAEITDPGPTGDFNWEGANWLKRSWDGAPMYNGDFESSNIVNPDANGHVKLKLTNPTGNSPQAAEMVSTKEGWGYGKYTVTIEKDLLKMQDEVVWGCMFTYDSNNSPSYNEIDLCEASAWGGTNGTYSWDTTQGHGYWVDAHSTTTPGNIVETFALPTSVVQTHQLVWEKDKLTFTTYNGDSTSAPLVKKTVFEGETVPEPARERVHFNLWVTGANEGQPDTVTPEEVTIRDFTFEKASTLSEPSPEPSPEVTDSAITIKAESLNGALGLPVTEEIYGLKDGGAYQVFERGTIYWSPTTGAYVNKGDIRNEWKNWGYENGQLGYPVSDEYTVSSAFVSNYETNALIQDFQGGSIIWSNNWAKVVHTEFNTKWKAYGSQNGLGLPTSNQVSSVNSGYVQNFERGNIYWTSPTGVRATSGVIGNTHKGLNAERGVLGYPKTDELKNLINGGSKQEFQGGYVTWSSATGAKPIVGIIANTWVSKGAETGRLGYATSAEYAVSGGKAQDFQGGKITWTSKKGISVSFNKR